MRVPVALRLILGLVISVGPILIQSGCGGGHEPGPSLPATDDPTLSPDTDTTRDGDEYR